MSTVGVGGGEERSDPGVRWQLSPSGMVQKPQVI